SHVTPSTSPSHLHSLAHALSLSLPFFFYSYGDHRDLHSFPTRRSSDLTGPRRPRSRCSGGAPAPATSTTSRPAARRPSATLRRRSEEHTSELQSRENLVCRLLLEKKNNNKKQRIKRYHTVESDDHPTRA